MTPEQIKDERAWLDTLTGYTPGPWLAGGDPMDRAVWSSPSDRVCFMAHSLGQDDERHFATARLIAAAPALRDRYAAALDEIERLRAAMDKLSDTDLTARQAAIIASAALKGDDQ